LVYYTPFAGGGCREGGSSLRGQVPMGRSAETENEQERASSVSEIALAGYQCPKILTPEEFMEVYDVH
jgi:hypothetical protein